MKEKVKDGTNDSLDVKLVAINTCFGSSDASIRRCFDAFTAFKKELDLPDNLKVDLIACPMPCFASSATATLKHYDPVPDITVISLFILKVPESYEQVPVNQDH